MNDDRLYVQPRLLRLLLKSFKGATFGIWSAEGRCLFLEGAALAVFGYSEPHTQYSGKLYPDIVPKGRSKSFKRVLDRVLAGEHVRMEYPVANLKTHMEIRGVPVLEGGTVTHALICTHDVTIHREREKILMKKNAVDTLTSLPKRAILDVHVEGLVRMGVSFSLMFIDLDNFKRLNDTQGHARGDELLRNVSRRIQAAIRSTDLAIRWGGDEFVVVVTDPTNVVTSAKRVLDGILEESVAFGSGVSAGVVVYPNDGEDLDTLMKAADAAMYRAKNLGGNRLEICVPTTRVRKSG